MGHARPDPPGASVEVPVIVVDSLVAPAWGSTIADCGEFLQWLTSTLTLMVDQSSLQRLLGKARQAYDLRPD